MGVPICALMGLEKDPTNQFSRHEHHHFSSEGRYCTTITVVVDGVLWCCIVLYCIVLYCEVCVLCGVVWCGVVWCGVVWCGVVK